VVSDGRNGIEVSSPTGTVIYQYAFATGAPVGTYSLDGLTNMAITTLHLHGVRILHGPASAWIASGWSTQTTELRGLLQQRIAHALVRTQVIDNVDGEAIIAETMSAPEGQWSAVLPVLAQVQRSLHVMAG
jgi:hypothetical protein